LIDYAHNPAGYEAVGGFVGNWQGEKVGVIGGPGDRRDDDLILLGKLSARMFDRIIVKEDKDTRGRQRGEVADLILKGINQENASLRPEVILDETEALEKALGTVSEGGLVVIFPESVGTAIDLIKKHQPLNDEEG
jgi:cyanophycin synthetase